MLQKNQGDGGALVGFVSQNKGHPNISRHFTSHVEAAANSEWTRVISPGRYGYVQVRVKTGALSVA